MTMWISSCYCHANLTFNVMQTIKLEKYIRYGLACVIVVVLKFYSDLKFSMHNIYTGWQAYWEVGVPDASQIKLTGCGRSCCGNGNIWLLWCHDKWSTTVLRHCWQYVVHTWMAFIQTVSGLGFTNDKWKR